MIPAEFAYRGDDPIHLPQFHAVHQAVKLVEVLLYLLIIVWIVFVVTFVEHGQHRLAIAIIGWIASM